MLKKRITFRKTRSPFAFIDFFIHFNTLLLIGGAGFMLYEFHHQFEEIRELLLSSSFGLLFIFFSLFTAVFKVVFLLYVFSHYLRYKSISSVEDHELPSITVIVPAYNEGRFVFNTLKSICESDYPGEKLQILAIDDGSKDDTWEWMQKAKLALGEAIEIYQQPENKGKKHALYTGFHMANGDIFVTIDSDSIIEKGTLRNLVSPFIVDHHCGAVAGNVKVYNNRKAIIPKMLSMSFAYSFGFIRAAQSHMKTVLCTPGALSAYRKDAVMACLDEWMNQTFMGLKTDIGEDRAMTNMIMKQGWHILFQSNALVYTKIPENYNNLRRMYIRWERSNVREIFMMSKFAFSNFRPSHTWNPRLLLFSQWLTMLAAYPAVLAMLLILFAYPRLFFSSTIVSVALFSIVPALYCGIKHNKRKAFWIFTYNIFHSFTLFWITPYAILTVRKRGWLTRNHVEAEQVGK